MKRREFLINAHFGYSVLVFADQIPPAPAAPATPEDFRRRVGLAAPRGAGRLAAEPNMWLVDLETDVLVAGGGLAGVCAAVAAARNGSKVILVQDRSRLGGNSSSEVKMHVVGANGLTGRPGWREGGLIEEFRLEDAVHNPQRSWEVWDLLLYDKVISEPNIVLLLDSVLYAAAKNGDRIGHVMVRCDKTEHLYRIKARIYCDCTGDSRLGLEADAEMRIGREARSEYGEQMAPEKADSHTLGSSILFTSRLHRRVMPFRPPAWARKVTREHLRVRKPGSWDYGYWWIEWGGDRDIVRENERIRFELLSIVLGVWDYIKNSGDYPSSDYYALEWIGMLPGKRGSRRMLGDHILTEKDLLSGGNFPDAVAIGGWPMDDHPPGGFDEPGLPPNRTLPTPEVYGIPLRSLYSRNVANLMMAGRNISCSHVAFTSTRVMATCAVAGQAVGTAAALCARYGLTPRLLASQEGRVSELQQALLHDDQTLKSMVNTDPRDLAREAGILASGHEEGARPARIIDGHVRDIPAPGGLQVHQWRAKIGSDGAWIELRWPGPRRIREIQITFDSGFERMLMLTANDAYTRRMVRAPQPETVRDYTISFLAGDGAEYREIVAVKGNYQRRNRHRFTPADATAVRIHISATNGDEYARIFEVRVYG